MQTASSTMCNQTAWKNVSAFHKRLYRPRASTHKLQYCVIFVVIILKPTILSLICHFTNNLGPIPAVHILNRDFLTIAAHMRCVHTGPVVKGHVMIVERDGFGA